VAENDGFEIEEQLAPAAAPEPQPFGPDDVVPKFRTDLHVARGASPALFDVSDPITGRKFTLYEFELAIARLLDGRRKVSQVVANGGRLGVPMDVDALYKFVRQMWHYGFLAGPGTGGDALGGHGVGEGGSWDAHEPWDDATRTLFETGERLMRQGRNADAASYFEAVLDAHPANPEATEMLALIARGQSLAAGPLGEARPGAARSGAGPEAQASAAPKARSRWPLAVAAVAVLALAGAAVVLLRPARRAPPPPPPPPVVAAPPPAAAPPPPPPAPPAPPAWRSAPVERRSHPALAELAAPKEGDLTWTKAPDLPVTKGEMVAVLKFAPPPTKKDAALARHIAELEKLATEDPVYRSSLEQARRDALRVAARRKVRTIKLSSPAAGVLARAPQPGGRTAEGERIARVLDPGVWQLAALVDGAEPAADAACEVVGDAPTDRATCRLAAHTAAGERTEVLAEVAAADAPWLARAASVWVRIAPAGTPRADAAAAPSPPVPTGTTSAGPPPAR
jgi:hypothetical protein